MFIEVILIAGYYPKPRKPLLQDIGAFYRSSIVLHKFLLSGPRALGAVGGGFVGPDGA